LTSDPDRLRASRFAGQSLAVLVRQKIEFSGTKIAAVVTASACGIKT